MKLIPLTKGKFAKVDDADFDWLNQWKWNACKAHNGLYYARRYDYSGPRRKLVLMARLILGVTDPKILTDHEDRDTLNNQRYNLRESNKSLNAINSDRVEFASGIYFDKNRCTYKAFKLRPKRYVGTFHTKEAAQTALENYS